MVAERTEAREQQDSGSRGGRGGFTLIELLVVIAAIALLMAILVPALASARRKTKAIVCQARLRQWGMILAIYTQDNEGRFPCNVGGTAGAWLLRGTLLSVSNNDANAPQDSLYHFRTKDIACCPMATKSPPVDGVQWGASAGLPPTFDFGPMVLPGRLRSGYPAWVIFQPGPPFVGSYGVNRYLFDPVGFGSLGAATGSAGGSSWLGVDVLALKGRDNIPVVLDSVAPVGKIASANVGPPPRQDTLGDNSFCIDRHDGCVNGLFLDWSLRKIGLKELWTLKWSRDFDTHGRWTRAGGVKPEDWPRWMHHFKD